MNKNIIYVLAILGAIFAYYLFRAFLGGVTSTANPNAMVQKAKCMADCSKGNLSPNCDQYCLQKTLGN